MQRQNAMTSDLCPSNLKYGEVKHGFRPIISNNFLIIVTIGDGESSAFSGGGGGGGAADFARFLSCIPCFWGVLGP